MASFKIDVKSPQAQSLQSSIQNFLAQKDYSTADDPVMAEYIVVMLANQKSPEQITAELLDLVGPEYEPAFTEWLWKETDRWINGSAGFSQTASPPRIKAEKKSLSPMRQEENRARRSMSPETQKRLARGESWQPGRASRDWDTITAPKKQEQRNDRSFWQKRTERPARELFSSAVSQETRNRPSHVGRTLAMDDPTLQQQQQQRLPDRPMAMRIQGVTQQASNGNGASVSIFGRAGIPDPRAAEFVPGGSSAAAAPDTLGPSIFSRIDPMLPNNEVPPKASYDAQAAQSQGYPTAPTETSLCRWNLKCTNPMCVYSHVSPANAGRNGDENALVLSQEACRFGAECTNKDCTRSHVSPSISFIDRKVATAVTALGFNTQTIHGKTPCRFQQSCTNASCTYAHYDKEGKIAPSPALSALAAHLVKEETAQAQDADMDDGEMEVQTEVKPSALDRALGESTEANEANAKRCNFGTACSRADCFFSHPPGRKLGGTTACRFGLGCTRIDCYYSHPPGRRLTEGGNSHISDRLSRFSSTADEGEMETIIPGQS